MRTILALVLLAAAACSFSYKNPAEDLRAGEVGGRAVVASVPTPGVAVSVKGSALAQGTRPTGKFLLLPLPAGTHTLLLRNGTGGLTARDVEIRYGRDGQPEGVWLGDVAVAPPTASASVRGSVRAAGASIGFGYVTDEVTGGTVFFAGNGFVLEGLSVGDHLLVLAGWDDGLQQWFVGGPVRVRVSEADAGFEKSLAEVALHPPSVAEGRIKVRLAAIGAVDLTGFTIGGLPGGATPDSTGLYDVAVPEGVYTLSVADAGGGSYELPPPVRIAVVSGRVTDVGTLYVTGLDAIARTGAACGSDADCTPGVCVDHVCEGAFHAPPVVPSSTPSCDTQSRFCSVGSSCAPQYSPVSAWCMDAGGGIGVCVPDGECCTVDGSSLVCGFAP